MEQIAIIGAGPGGAELLKTLLGMPGIKVIGIADTNPHSPGLALARQERIFTTNNFQDLIKKPGKKLVFDATGAPAVAKQLEEAANEEVIVICPEVSRLIWRMVDEKEQVNQTLVSESDALISFIEEGLENLETINAEHEKALGTAAAGIKELAELAQKSEALIKETAAVMQLIRNVADQTRILGINASIESARAGEYGRGFGVVADSIHELSTSSIKSSQSVSGTMEAIQATLGNIGLKIADVVKDIGNIEKNQAKLTQELHTSLEEMVDSANRLAEIAKK